MKSTNSIIYNLREELTEKLNAIKNDRNIKIKELNQKLEIECSNVKMWLDKIKQLSEYMNSAKKLIKISFDEGLCKLSLFYI